MPYRCNVRVSTDRLSLFRWILSGSDALLGGKFSLYVIEPCPHGCDTFVDAESCRQLVVGIWCGPAFNGTHSPLPRRVISDCFPTFSIRQVRVSLIVVQTTSMYLTFV